MDHLQTLYIRENLISQIWHIMDHLKTPYIREHLNFANLGIKGVISYQPI